MVAPFDWKTFARHVQAGRQSRTVMVQAFEHTVPVDTLTADFLNAGVQRCGLTGIGDWWVEIPQNVAHWFLVSLLHRALIWNIEMMKRQRAERLAAQCMAQFHGQMRCFTNGGLYSKCPGVVADKHDTYLRIGAYPFLPDERRVMRGTFAPLMEGEAIEDSGVVCVDSRLFGLFWFANS